MQWGGTGKGLQVEVDALSSNLKVLYLGRLWIAEPVTAILLSSWWMSRKFTAGHDPIHFDGVGRRTSPDQERHDDAAMSGGHLNHSFASDDLDSWQQPIRSP